MKWTAKHDSFSHLLRQPTLFKAECSSRLLGSLTWQFQILTIENVEAFQNWAVTVAFSLSDFFQLGETGLRGRYNKMTNNDPCCPLQVFAINRRRYNPEFPDCCKFAVNSSLPSPTRSRGRCTLQIEAILCIQTAASVNCCLPVPTSNRLPVFSLFSEGLYEYVNKNL